jgi:hypothetical protein
MLKETINNSISSRARHLGEEQIVRLFYKTDELDPTERYAVSIMFSEATLQEILLFLRKHNIPFSKAMALYQIACQSRVVPNTKKGADKYEWLLG